MKYNAGNMMTASQIFNQTLLSTHSQQAMMRRNTSMYYKGIGNFFAEVIEQIKAMKEKWIIEAVS